MKPQAREETFFNSFEVLDRIQFPNSSILFRCKKIYKKNKTFNFWHSKINNSKIYSH